MCLGKGGGAVYKRWSLYLEGMCMGGRGAVCTREVEGTQIGFRAEGSACIKGIWRGDTLALPHTHTRTHNTHAPPPSPPFVPQHTTLCVGYSPHPLPHPRRADLPRYCSSSRLWSRSPLQPPLPAQLRMAGVWSAAGPRAGRTEKTGPRYCRHCLSPTAWLPQPLLLCSCYSPGPAAQGWPASGLGQWLLRRVSAWIWP